MIELRNIGKQFPGVRALHDVSLDVRPGEVLGLVGENGAGKSTLIKILGGVYAAGSYSGELAIDGARVAFRSTLDARRAGIAVVHQELALVPDLTVAENLMLGREQTRFGVVDTARLEVTAKRLMAEVLGDGELDLDLAAPVGELGIGIQQLIEIARALADRAKLIVLDEPTAPLTESETDRLFELVRARRAEGASFIYISHRLDEIRVLCDRVAVLRDGELVTIVEPTAELVPLMTGEAIADRARDSSKSTSTAAAVLCVRDLAVPHPTLPRDVVQGLSFDVRPGEVVALAGAMGSGRTATLAALFGAAKRGHRGEVRVDGKLVELTSPRAAIAAGFAYVPEDRKALGLVLGMGVADNLTLAALGRMSRCGVVDDARTERSALQRVRELSIKVPSLGAEVTTLSGGNQQKIVIGKWLELAPRVLLLDEPTRGVDVGAKAELYALIEALTGAGHAVVLASSDLPEVVRLADRVVVLREGKPIGELAGAEITPLAIMQLAVGSLAAVIVSEPGEAASAGERTAVARVSDPGEAASAGERTAVAR